MKSKIIALMFLATMVCSTSSCVTVGMNDETKARVDKALAEVAQVAKILQDYEDSVKSLVERLNRLIDKFAPEKKAEKPEEEKK